MANEESSRMRGGWDYSRDQPFLSEVGIGASPNDHINWDFAVKDKVYCTMSDRNGIVIELKYTVDAVISEKEYKICYRANDKVEYEWETREWLEKGHKTVID